VTTLVARSRCRTRRGIADQLANAPDFDHYTRAKTAYFDEVQPEFESWT